MDAYQQQYQQSAIPQQPPQPLSYIQLQDSFSQRMSSQTRRRAEEVAYRYFVANNEDTTIINWVNQANESNCPYDLKVTYGNESITYFEVLVTLNEKQNIFDFPVRHLQWALDNGVAYGVVIVVLLNCEQARVQMLNDLSRKMMGQRNVGETKVQLLVTEVEEPWQHTAL